MGGNKVTSRNASRYTTLGHEGVGMVEAVGEDVDGLSIGDFVVILPHHFPADYTSQSTFRPVDPENIGLKQTLHIGWDIDGCFADYCLVPTNRLVRIAPEYIRQAAMFAPDLGDAIFAMTEPMLCVLSSYVLLQQSMQKLDQAPFRPGRALVIGCGPIGLLHGIVLRGYGYTTWFSDIIPSRIDAIRRCLGSGFILDSVNIDEFDLVIVTASNADAIKQGERHVKDGGVVYLFAGLNANDYTAMDDTQTFFYERVHRIAKPLVTTKRIGNRDKKIMYIGHSGYYDYCAPQAIASVAANAAVLDRSMTGLISGWGSSVIGSRLPETKDWVTEDGSPALISILQGTDLRSQHLKILIRVFQPELNMLEGGSELSLRR
jgi:threonine dehydrogenase-like Zn-dependent dehydrogenase